MTEPDAAELLRRFASLPGAERLEQALEPGWEAYLVGGAVRDLLLGGVPFDVDIVLAGAADPAVLAQRLGARPRVHDRFGTATVRPDSETPIRYDLALARRERYAHPGALPEVAPATVDEDLLRRDFTVNAIALGIAGPRRGQLIAPAGALADLRARQLRVLHDASFTDDPTRLLRLARYAGRLELAIESHTAELARAAVRGGALNTISGPRIGADLPETAAAWEVLADLGVDRAVAPGLGLGDPRAARHAAELLRRGDPGVAPGAVVLAAAMLGVPESARRPLLDRLGLEAGYRGQVLAAARDAAAVAARVPADGRPSQLLDIVPPDAPVTVALAAALAAPAPAAMLERWLLEWSRTRLQIGGGDLIAAGMKPGPALGAALRAALRARLDGVALTRQQQLAAALAAAGGGAGES